MTVTTIIDLKKESFEREQYGIEARYNKEQKKTNRFNIWEVIDDHAKSCTNGWADAVAALQ